MERLALLLACLCLVAEVTDFAGDETWRNVARHLRVLKMIPNYRMHAMQKLLCSIASSIMAIALTSCGPRAEQAANTAANGASEVVTDAGNMTENAVDVTADALTPTPSGQEFVDKAAKSDAFEIAAAKVAQNNAASSEVKAFAAEMIKAHIDSTAKIKAAAAQAPSPITPHPALSDDQSDDLADLGKLKGADFDRKYISGQVEAHEDALALMERYAEGGDVAMLKTAAGEIVPVVRRHLEMARKLNR